MSLGSYIDGSLNALPREKELVVEVLMWFEHIRRIVQTLPVGCFADCGSGYSG